MKEYQSLNHTRWDCKYHVVFIPKRRKKQVFGVIRKYLGDIFHELARQKESKIVEGHLRPDHVHMCLTPREIEPAKKLSPKHFTRNRKLSFPKLVTFILSIVSSGKAKGVDVKSGEFFRAR